MEHVGIYARLSVEHDSRKDDSIENQVALARGWLQQQRAGGAALTEYGCYIDKGYTGTDFDRPAFQRMLRDISSGKIQCIVCKDTSRLGRDHIRTGEYMERIFPMLGVRLVCISEGYDSAVTVPGSLTVNLRNLMNEWYAQDISRRVRMVKEQKKQEGEYLGSRAPYGYQVINKNGKRKLEEEAETMAVIRQMTAWRKEGKSIRQIREELWSRGVSPPGQYMKTGQVYGEHQKKWNPSTVRRVILSYTRGDYHTA